MSDRMEQVTWQELAALCETLDLTPGHSSRAGRTFAHVDGTVVWADTEGVRLDDHKAPGAWRLQAARIRQWGADLDAEEEARLAAMTPEQRQQHHADRARSLAEPDPPEWMKDAYLERMGRTPGYR